MGARLSCLTRTLRPLSNLYSNTGTCGLIRSIAVLGCIKKPANPKETTKIVLILRTLPVNVSILRISHLFRTPKFGRFIVRCLDLERKKSQN